MPRKTRVTTLQSQQNSLCFSGDLNIFPVFFIYSTTTSHRDILLSIHTMPIAAEPVAKISFHYWAVPKSKFVSKPKDCNSIPPQSYQYILKHDKKFKNFPVLKVNSLCKTFKKYFWQIPCVFPVWEKEHPNSLVSLCHGNHANP